MKFQITRNKLVVSAVLILLLAAFSPATAANSTRVWVEFAPGAQNQVQGLLQNVGAEFHYTFDGLGYFVVSLPENAVAGLANNPNILSIEADPERYPIGAPISGELLSAVQDTVGPNGQTIPWGVDAVQARDVWDTNLDGAVDNGTAAGSGKTVCIIDSGFYSAHEDLSGANLVGGLSQVDDNYARDGLGHGTHVAGTIAGVNNTLGVVGVAPNVSLFIVKIFNDDGVWTRSSDLVDAINTCASNGADVISMSLGGGRASVPENKAFQSLYDQGILHVAAAGNDGNTALSYPASYDSVMSVAAIDESLTVADFSQQNTQVEISGPGVGVLSTVPYIDSSSLTVNGTAFDALHIEFSARGSASGTLVDGGLCDTTGSWSGAVVLCERGAISFYDKVINVQNSGGAAAVIYNNVPGNFSGTLGDGNSSTIVALSLSQEDGQFIVANLLGSSGTVDSQYFWPADGYAFYDGTSMATPHVSAVAALVWSAVPNATNLEIRDALTATALDLGASGRDAAYGFGLVQAAAAINYLGTGGTNTAPTVSITSPASGATFDSGSVVSLQGTASDAEDGSLSAAIEWTSSLDGALGTGASVNAALSDGTHTITATVTDSGSQSATDSITVTIGGGGTGGGALDVTVTTDKPSYTSGETARITIVVTDGVDPVAGASVSIQISTPKFTYSGSGVTDASGTVVFTFKTNANKDGSGLYAVTATATATGYQDGSGSTSFTVSK